MRYWQSKKKSEKKILRKVSLAAGGIIAGFIISRFFLITYNVADESMNPFLKKGDTVLILKVITPKTGDVVLSRIPYQDDRVLLKRIAGIEDDVIEIKSKIFYINSRTASFPWKTLSDDKRIFPVDFSRRDNMPAIKLKRNEFFLLGDNLDLSYDSREFGTANKKDIIGKVIYKF